MPDQETRPQLIFAYFCQEALIERDGSLSTIRLIVSWTQSGPLGGDKPYFTIAPRLVVGFVCETAGRHLLSVTAIEPSGNRRTDTQTSDLTFEPGKVVSYFCAEYVIHVREQGPHWFEVRLDGEFYTRIPLAIRYQPEKPDPALPLGPRKKQRMN